MKRYIALLRGVNISGKNKVPMKDLKMHCENLGFENVSTYLNSGNVVFSTDEDNEITIAQQIKELIRERFSLDIPVFVIIQDELTKILQNAPAWWGNDNKDLYDNLIFVMPQTTAQDIAERIGEPTEDLEQISIYENSIFWTFDRIKYAKANWWKKTASAGISEMITIRTGNTLKKISKM